MLQVVKEEYFREKQAKLGTAQPVQFESEQIELDIPLEGVKLEEGWVITPLTAPVVSACPCSSVMYSGFRLSSKMNHQPWTAHVHVKFNFQWCSVGYPKLQDSPIPAFHVTGM